MPRKAPCERGREQSSFRCIACSAALTRCAIKCIFRNGKFFVIPQCPPSPNKKTARQKQGAPRRTHPASLFNISQCALRPAQSTLRAQKRPGEGFLLLEGQNALAVGRIAAVHEVEGCLCILEVPSVGDAAAQIHLALVDQIDDILELAVLQAAAANVQLLGSNDERPPSGC